MTQSCILPMPPPTNCRNGFGNTKAVYNFQTVTIHHPPPVSLITVLDFRYPCIREACRRTTVDRYLASSGLFQKDAQCGENGDVIITLRGIVSLEPHHTTSCLGRVVHAPTVTAYPVNPPPSIEERLIHNLHYKNNIKG